MEELVEVEVPGLYWDTPSKLFLHRFSETLALGGLEEELVVLVFSRWGSPSPEKLPCRLT